MAGVRSVGEHALLLDTDRPAAVAHWVRTVAAERHLPVVDVVPAARTVLVTFPASRSVADLRSLLRDVPDDLERLAPQHGDPVRIPVRFDGPDLAAVARHAGTDRDGVVRLLLAADLVVEFCGFSPGFAYLGGVPAPLRAPRRTEPRTRVPAGSLALADEYAAVYPRESPGGWNLVGRTDTTLFDVDREPPALLTAGTRVRLEAQP